MFIGNIGVSTEFTASQVEATQAFAKGLVRVIEEDGVIGVLNTITGEKFFSGGSANFVEIMHRANQFGVGDFRSIFGATAEEVASGSRSSEYGYQRLSDITRSLNEAVFGATDDFAQQARAFAGIEGASGNLVIERFGFMDAKEIAGKSKEDVIAPLQKAMRDITSSMKGRFVGGRVTQEAIEQNPSLGGLINVQKDAAVLLRFRVGDQYLTSEQINRLLVFTGSEVLDPAKLTSTLAADESDDILAKVGTAMGKASKRFKAHTSERSFTMGTDSVSSLIDELSAAASGRTPKGSKIIATLDDAMLRYNPGFELILKTLGLQDEYTDTLLGSAADATERAALYRQRSGVRLITEVYGQKLEGDILFGEDFFKTIIKSYVNDDQQLTDDVFEKFRKVLSGPDGTISKRLKEGNAKFSLSDVIQDINNSTDLDQRSKSILQDTIKTALKKTQDGSQFVTDAIFEHQGKVLQQQAIKVRRTAEELKNKSRTRALTAEEKQSLRKAETSFADIKKQFSTFAEGELLDAEGNIGKFSVREMDNQTARIIIKRRTI